MATPALVVVGHLTRDLIVRGRSRRRCLGGVPAHLGLAARALGVSTGVVSMVGPDLEPEHIGALRSAGLDLGGLRTGAAPTTAFVNAYARGRRAQSCTAVADRIGPDAVPERYGRARAVHLGPVMGEVDREVAERFQRALVSLDVQGLIRRRAGDRVEGARLDPELLPARLDVLKVGEGELELATGTSDVREGAERARAVVVTLGARGSHVYDGRHRSVPPCPVREVDPTGAGDAYMAGLHAALLEGRGLAEAARLASACGALSVTQVGASFPFEREEVERLAWGG